MMIRFAYLLVPVLAGSVCSCSSVTPGLGFDDVKKAVSDRAGLRIHWCSDSSEDAEVAAAVNSFLERNLTADEAVQVALLNNHNLQALYEELDIAQADLVQAGLLRNPIFSGEVRFPASGGAAGMVFDVSQDFVSLFSMPLRRGRAQATFEAVKIRLTSAVLDTAFEARIAFYDYQMAEQMREMRATVLEATAASYDLAKRLRRAGNNRDLDVANERALHEQSKLDLAEAEAQVIKRRERMNELMGLWGAQAEWKATTRLPEIPERAEQISDLERKAIESSLDLALLRREAEVSARSLGIAKPFAWLNDADVGVAAEREASGGTWSMGPSLALPIPLFDHGQAAVGHATAQLRQVWERIYSRAIEIRSSARAAQSLVISSYERAKYYEKVMLPLRQQVVDESQLQYNAMQISPFQLLESKRDQINTGAEYIRSLRDYWVARASLDQILVGRVNSSSE